MVFMQQQVRDYSPKFNRLPLWRHEMSGTGLPLTTQRMSASVKMRGCCGLTALSNVIGSEYTPPPTDYIVHSETGDWFHFTTCF